MFESNMLNEPPPRAVQFGFVGGKTGPQNLAHGKVPFGQAWLVCKYRCMLPCLEAVH